MNIEKRGFTMPFSLEAFIDSLPKGHWEPYTMTPEENAERRRAKRLLKELKRNPWIDWGYDGPELAPRKTQKWVTDE